MSYECVECGWTWPLDGPPWDGAECDNCGGDLEVDYDTQIARMKADFMATDPKVTFVLDDEPVAQPTESDDK